RIYQRDYRAEGPVHVHDPTQPDRSALQNVPGASGAEEELHARHAALDEIERARRGLRDVDDPSLDERAAIVDPHLDRAAVVQVLDAQAGAERERPVGRRECIGIETLAARRAIRAQRATIVRS